MHWSDDDKRSYLNVCNIVDIIFIGPDFHHNSLQLVSKVSNCITLRHGTKCLAYILQQS